MKGQLGEKIRKIRELKGYSQEYMSTQMDISQRAYSKVEREETKLDWHRINEIARILELNPIILISFDESFVFHNYNQSGKFMESELHYSFVDELKQQYENQIASLKDEIAFLRGQINITP